MELNRKEIVEILCQPELARIATVSKDCKPHVTPVWFLYENGIVYMTTGKNSVKVRNLRNNPHVAITIDITERGLNNRGVILTGKAEIETDDEIAKKIFLKYLGSLDHPSAKKLLEMTRVVIKLKPEKIISWDFREKSE